MVRSVRNWPAIALPLIVASALCHAEMDLAELYASSSPSVVTLTTYSATGAKLGQGSGFILDKSGVIVTCLHVVGEAKTIEVQTSDEATHIATALIRSNKEWDIALIKTGALAQKALKLAPPESLRVGTAIVAIGSPLGYGNSLSQGIVSGLRQNAGKNDLIQLTAAVSPGSSGGPILLASNGEVLGMTVAMLTTGQNINFAVPGRVISELLKTVDEPAEQKLSDFAPEVKKSLAEAKKNREALEKECSDADAELINKTIEDAIASGVGIYNIGDFLGCFRVYEGAAYKLLYKLGDHAPTAGNVLKAALKKADATGNDTEKGSEKAWIMRHAFDSIVGVKMKSADGKMQKKDAK